MHVAVPGFSTLVPRPMSSLVLHPLGTVLDTNGQLLVELLHSPTQQVLCARWHGNLTGREVLHVAAEYLRAQTTLRYPLLLNDKRHATGDWSESLDWLEYEWLPQALASGLRAVAYVFSPDMHNQLASLEFFTRIRRHVAIQLFYDVPTAWQWLRTQPHNRRNASSPTV